MYQSTLAMTVRSTLRELNMQINITGRASKEEKKYLNQAILFYMKRLIRKTLLKNFVIDISIRKTLVNNDEGYCEITGWNTRNNPREFLVVIKKCESFRKMLMTLAHECVHVKQFALGELSENHAQWRGRRMKDDIEYWESPWEIEAFGRERGLYTLFCEQYGYKFIRSSNERDE